MKKERDRSVPCVDLRKEVCPVTYVCASIALEKIESGESVEFLLGDEEAARDVPRTLAADGHLVEESEWVEGRFRLLVRKDGGRIEKE